LAYLRHFAANASVQRLRSMSLESLTAFFNRIKSAPEAIRIHINTKVIFLGGRIGAWSMRRRRKPRKLWPPPALTEDQILAWADAYHQLKGRWPRKDSGAVPGSWVERWSAINAALQKGNRGLPGGSSLARLLAARRGVRNRKGLPHRTVLQILHWADAYHSRTGTWPQPKTKPNSIPGTNGETWLAVDTALRCGIRGLPGGSSLPQVLAEHRDVRNHADLPPLSVDQVLAWADAFHKRTGEWPKLKNWPEVIYDSGGETWGNVIQAIGRGLRGFTGNETLFDLLAKHRGVRNVGHLPPLSERQILAWADAHDATHDEWPTCRCLQQTIPDSGGERWLNVDQALRKGLRGFPGGSSLSKLLAKHRGVRNLKKGMAARMPGGEHSAPSSL
jgi:hypothetical protein